MQFYLMTVAEYVADYLANKGCTHAFGVVGGANLSLFCEIGKKLKVVSCHHEQAAAVASAYFYRTCKRIAPCLVANGGAQTNAITGVLDSYMDYIPMLVISGNEMTKFWKEKGRTIGFQGFNPIPSVSHITKLAVTVDNPLGARLAMPSI